MKIVNRLFNFSVIFLLFSTAGVLTVKGQQPYSSDSLELFRNMTDINKQVQMINNETNERAAIIPLQSNILQVRDTIRKSELMPKGLTLRIDSTGITKQSFWVYPKVALDSTYVRSHNGTLQLPKYSYNTESLSGMTFRDTIFYNPLYLPMIFTGITNLDDKDFYPHKKENYQQNLLIPADKTFDSALIHADFIEKVRYQYYKNYPERVRLSVTEFDHIPGASKVEEDVIRTFNPFRKPIEVESGVVLSTPDVETVKIKRRYWVVNGDHSLQFAQNYFSNNWYNGRKSDMNINSNQVLRANYKKNKFKFNNTLEWRLSLFNSPDDSVRQYRIGNDMLRYYGTIGMDAFLKKWQYSSNVEVKTQMFNNYPVNSKELRSAFISPLYVNAGVGLSYELKKSYQKVRHRNLTWKLDLSPVSINYRYVGNPNVDVKRYGIEEGKKNKLELGSTIISDINYNFNRYINWHSRFKYFTSYKNMLAELENTLNMDLTNSFSTQLQLNLRYDDSVPMDPKLKYLQIYEGITFGLNYKW